MTTKKSRGAKNRQLTRVSTTAKHRPAQVAAPEPATRSQDIWKYLVLAALAALAVFAAGNYAKVTFDPGTATAATAAVSRGVQKLDVRVLGSSYDPTNISLKAGVPAEITFSQASGCTGSVQSSQLGFNEDLTSGPKTVKLKGLAPGTYGFACGMGMVSGRIIVS